MRTTLAAALMLAFAGLPACSSRKLEPEIASSASSGAYAKSYPEELNAAVKAFSDHRAEARDLLREYPSYPAKLKDPDWGKVREIIELADEDGHGQAYVSRARRADAVAAFFEEEKEELARKVGGSVAFVAKKRGCDADVAGGVLPALKDAIEKQIDKELDEASESRQLIVRHRGSLGKENVAALEKQARSVSRASYLARVRIFEDRDRVARMLSEAGRVSRAAGETIAAEEALQESKKLSDAEKKASRARVEEMTKVKASIDGAVKLASTIGPGMDDEIRKVQKEHDDALGALAGKIKEKER